MSIVNNLVYNSVKKPEKLNIFSFFYNGTFDLELLKTGHNFYGCLDGTAYAWPGFKDRKFDNLKLLGNINDIKTVGIDLILFNSRQRNEQFFNITKGLHCPGLIIDHDILPTNKFFLKKHLQSCKIPSVSTSIEAQEQYKVSENIMYNIEEISGQFDKDIDILIVGTFGQEHFPWLFQLKQMFPSLKMVGHNPQIPFSELVETYKDYQNLFKRAHIFVNLPQQLNVSYELLWALSNNCAVISTDIPFYKNLLNDDNRILIRDVREIGDQIRSLINNKKKLDKLKNHNTDLSLYKNNSISEWTNIFNKYSGIYND